eukprot:12437088-Alexandrium_andersonii.AAC.1
MSRLQQACPVYVVMCNIFALMLALSPSPGSVSFGHALLRGGGGRHGPVGRQSIGAHPSCRLGCPATTPA